MRFSCRTGARLSAVLALATHAHAASAEADRGRASKTERAAPSKKPPAGSFLLFPPGVVVPYASTSIDGAPSGERQIDLGLGVVWGAADDLQIEAHLGPIHLGPAQGQGPHRLVLTRGFLHTRRFELGGSLSMSLDTSPRIPVVSTVQPGLVAAAGAEERLWFDAGIHLPISTGPAPRLGLSLPIRAHVPLSRRVEVRLDSGLEVNQLGESAAAVPLGIALRYRARRFFVLPYVSGPQFYTPATGRVDAGTFSAGILVGIPLRR
ncbi:hypothetical protein [Polyangium mundeleinium]|uniref:Outer membrane protein beta-barrel domain-containing protein n=1 Tax=Polyangium mundeleinium TaxID=2995306 RepID=A0ABT5ESB9_9BACT|nr:hypothetical protein [Polyangium mundeleinium]MDC0744651.1 hypothetical protein [Polyangium mundeleinium]